MVVSTDALRAAHYARIVAEDYAYASYWNLRGLTRSPAPDDYLSGTRATVIAIPGIYETWRFLSPVINALHDAGHPVLVFPELRRNERPIITTAEIVAARIAALDLHDAVIFAHSKGGLIGKYVMQRLDPDRRVERMVAVCSPFGGTRMTRYVPWTKQLQVFSPTSPVLRGLAAYREVNTRITSVFSRFDPHIPEGSELVGATNIRLPVDGHFKILGSQPLIDTVLATFGDDRSD